MGGRVLQQYNSDCISECANSSEFVSLSSVGSIIASLLSVCYQVI